MIPKTRSIRSVVIAIGALISLLAGCSTIQWEHDYKKGVRRAAQLRKRVLVQFHSNVNPDCIEMDRKVFTDPEVQKLMGEYVAVRLDYLLNKKLADDLDVQIVPTFLVLRHDGAIVGSHVGKMNETKFKYFLIKQRYN
ncbi:MAG: thioredoxin family protein [Planctomycetota bacterium]